MNVHEREMRLSYMTSFVNSREWEILREEMLNQKKNLEARINNMLETADSYDRSILVQQGIKMGIEWCLARPAQIIETNKSFLDRVREKLFS